MTDFTPNRGQLEALTGSLPVLVLAGAGTGKTTVLTHRIAALVAGGQARPDQILALTFAEKAAAEMSERLASLLAEKGLEDAGREVHCSTFHSFGAEIIRDYAPLLGMESDCRVLTTPECWQIMSRVLDTMDFHAIDLLTGGVAGVIDNMLALFSQAQDHLVGPEELQSYVDGSGSNNHRNSLEEPGSSVTQATPASGTMPALIPVGTMPALIWPRGRGRPRPDHDGVQESGSSQTPTVVSQHRAATLAPLREAAQAYRLYQEVKRERGCLDFGDLLLLPVVLFDRHPELLRDYHERFRYLFVDEYQDTNHAQKQLLMRLLPPGAPICVIGDDDQSIYGFRGAVISNILDFPREPSIAAAGLTLVKLTENRRSGPAVLDVANRIIERIEKPEEYRKRLEPAEERPITATAGHYVAASGESEARWIARTIQEKQGTPEVVDPTGKKRGYGAFAVLCRKRSLFPAVASALEEAGIPFELIGGTGFFGRWEIRDILSYLRVLADPADNIALARVLQSRSWRLSDRDLFYLSRDGGRNHKDTKGTKGHEEGTGGRGEKDAETRGHGDAEKGRGEWEGEAPAEPRTRVGGGDVPAHHSAAVEDLPFRLIDAISNYERIPGLSPEALPRLGELRRMFDSLSRSALRLPIPDLVQEVIERAGYWRELSAREGRGHDLDSHLALLNLGKLVELARQFQGSDATLESFVEYVQYALESGGDEAEVRPVDEESDAVKVMTVHQAKGLEFPAVFVPGLAGNIFPVERNSSRREEWSQLPVELRGDRESYPSLEMDGVKTEKEIDDRRTQYREQLKKREQQEELRLFYVAVTRAQRALFLSRAHFYFSTVKPRVPSEFWTLVVGEEGEPTGLSDSLGEEPAPDANPRSSLAGLSASRSPSPPGLARLLLDSDRGAGWVASVAAAQSAEWERARSRADTDLAAATQLPVLPVSPSPRLPVSVSCSGLMLYGRCPRLYRYLQVDRLPSRPAPWARTGTEVHRLIEEMARSGEPGSAGDDERDPDPDEQAPPHHGGRTPGLNDLLDVYRRSPYAARRAARVEEPFALPLGANLLRGRIDRLDHLDDGSWQLVDFKASRFHGQLLPGQRLQMQLYALAACRLWGVDPDQLVCQILFLADGHLEGLAPTAEELQQVERWAEEHLGLIQSGAFPRANNGDACTHCDYHHLC